MADGFTMIEGHVTGQERKPEKVGSGHCFSFIETHLYGNYLGSHENFLKLMLLMT
jgi:hypothetical protein